MPKLGTKPALTLGVTAAIVMGASGISAQARVSTSSTPPTTQAGRPGPGLGADATALAKRLGVSVSDLQAAVKAVRDAETKPDENADRVTEAKTIADELSVDQATVQTVLDAGKPQAKAGTRPSGTPPTTPPAGAPNGTTPPPAGAPTGTTPPSGGPGRGGPGGGHGGPGGGRHSEADDATLVAALVKATGKDETAVKAALTKADAVRDAAQKERAADFAKKLAAQLHLGADTVTKAIENSRPTLPSKAARQSTGQNG